ncbi:MAG: hypothetical protein EA341_16735 [Mongoliibacter sp.]|nr:MAG: hypothetical protein EA341_16735 [Mongoliibacter sp.]
MDQCNQKAIARPRDKSLQESRLKLKYRIMEIEFRPPASGRNNEVKKTTVKGCTLSNQGLIY